MVYAVVGDMRGPRVRREWEWMIEEGHRRYWRNRLAICLGIRSLEQWALLKSKGEVGYLASRRRGLEASSLPLRCSGDQWSSGM